MTRARTVVLACLFAALAGYCAFSTFASYYLANSFATNTAITGLRQILNNSGVFTYGTIVSVNALDQSITLSFPDPITGAPRSLVLYVTDQTLIQKEELQADASGTYVGLSALSPGSTSDLTPGTRIATTFIRSGTGLVATTILFGNPL